MIRRAVVMCFAVAASACNNEPRTVPVVDAGPVPLPRAVCLDNDGDGVPGTGDCSGEPTVDCNDRDALSFPGALELCNGLDENCNSEIDEGLPVVAYYRDEDGDGVGAMKTGEGCKAPPMGNVTQAGDCDDTTANVRPGQAETCNGVDDDCDGTRDNGLPFQDFYVDADGDGFGSSNAAPVSACQTVVQGRVTNPGDCNDANPTIKPGAIELCNKVDDNCDGQMDNGIAYVGYYPDVDGDGFGDALAQSESSCSPLAGKVENNADCNDAIATVKPGAPEVCNGADDDCDTQADEGLTFVSYYSDTDGDGFGAQGSTPLSSCIPVPGRVTNATDCNDASPMVKPTATETCNGVDDNCAGGIDDGLAFTNYYLDADGDGSGAANGTPLSACAPVSGRVTNANDCNDGNPQVKPLAPETCNAVDDDCDGQTDEGLTFADYYPDGDGDGHGSSSAQATRSCTAIAGRVTNNTDCNDSSASVNPTRPEVCNGLDDNCAGGADEGLATQSYFIDSDSDGRGAQGSTPVASCGPIVGRVTNSDDCNDSASSVRPGAPELCNGVDDNCDNVVDNGVATQNYYVDSDGDGFGAAGSVAQASCSAVQGRVANNTDCNDMNAAVKPTATELCNQVDDDCDLQTDEGLAVLSYYPDVDGDGFGALGASAQVSCAAVPGKVTSNTDCNDSVFAIKPGAAETCNVTDDDCDTLIDEGLPTQSYYVDADMDGFGVSGGSAVVSCRAQTGRVANNTDCNDTNAAIRPTAVEVCNNVDDNCAGGIDEGNPGGGGACSTGQSGVCGPGTLRCTAGTVSCQRNVAPSTEVCNTSDDDCDGVTDEGFAVGDACSAGQGVCARTGTTVCNAAGSGVQCSATAGAPTTPACDGQDNDCDGITDEPLLTSTANVGATAYTDLEVRPYYYSAASCAGGANGTGSDALAGGALLMGAGASGISFQRLDTSGSPTGGIASITGLTYSDVDFAQAGDGFVVAGIWSSNNAEIDLFYVDSAGTQRDFVYTQFLAATGQTLDSLRLVRGNGRRVTLVWRETGVGIKLAQVEACNISGSWELRAPGCSSVVLTSTTISPSTTAVAGVAADSTHLDWTASQACPTTATQRRIAIAYLSSATSLNFFRVNENGASKETETVATTTTSPSVYAEPDLTYFKDSGNVDQFLVGFVTKDSGAATPRADLNYWLSSAPTWTYFTWLDYATQNGVNSIARPRTSATATGLWISALRHVADSSTFKRQVMTRTIDLLGVRVPSASAVEIPITSGACSTDPACRPGDKSGFTNFAPFSRVYYAGSGSTPAGTYASALSCN